MSKIELSAHEYEILKKSYQDCEELFETTTDDSTTNRGLTLIEGGNQISGDINSVISEEDLKKNDKASNDCLGSIKNEFIRESAEDIPENKVN